MSRLARDGTAASRETKFSGANGTDREIFVLFVQLTTGRVGKLTRLIHTLLYICDGHTYSLGSIRITATLLAALLSSFVSSTDEGPRIQ